MSDKHNNDLVKRLRDLAGDDYLPEDSDAIMREAVNEIERLRQATRWQPMETAPKDGSPFWGKLGDDAIRVFWHSGFKEFISSFRRSELTPGMIFEETGATCNDHSPVIRKIEAWMPLPSPPAEQSVRGE